MTADTGQHVNASGYGHPCCFVCGRRIRLTDAFADRRVLTEDGGTTVKRGHRACLKEGVERWCRENRPAADPLHAARTEGWEWHDEPPTRLD